MVGCVVFWPVVKVLLLMNNKEKQSTTMQMKEARYPLAISEDRVPNFKRRPSVNRQ
jgi:hypothetical protein